MGNIAIVLIFMTQGAPQLLFCIFCIFPIPIMPVLNRRAIFTKRLEPDGKQCLSRALRMWICFCRVAAGYSAPLALLSTAYFYPPLFGTGERAHKRKSTIAGCTRMADCALCISNGQLHAQPEIRHIKALCSSEENKIYVS